MWTPYYIITCPVWEVYFNGDIGCPTLNGFIHHQPKDHFVCEKSQVYLRGLVTTFFQLTLNLLNVFFKSVKTRKKSLQFSIVDLRARWPHTFVTMYWKFPQWAAAAKYPSKKFCFFKISDLVCRFPPKVVGVAPVDNRPSTNKNGGPKELWPKVEQQSSHNCFSPLLVGEGSVINRAYLV